MIRSLPFLAVAIGLSIGACAFLKGEEPTLKRDAAADAQCVIKEILAGGQVAEDIGLACGGLALVQVVAIAHDYETRDTGAVSVAAAKVRPRTCGGHTCGGQCDAGGGRG